MSASGGCGPRSSVKRRELFCLMSALVSYFATWLAYAADVDDDLSAASILRSRLMAMGGEDSLRAVDSRRIVGRIKFGNSPELALITIEAAAPNLLRTTVEAPGAGRIIEAYDGTVAWRKLPGSSAYKLTGAEAARLRRSADFYWDLNLETSYSNWTRVGIERIDGAPAYHLSGVDVSQRRIHLWLDCETWRLSGMERVGWFGPFSVEGVRLQYSDYRSVDGIWIPFLIRQTRPEASAFELCVDSVTHGVEIDEDRILWSAQASLLEAPME